MTCLFIFFSSRRRHTRLQGDWSSDVCSSDLPGVCGPPRPHARSGTHTQGGFSERDPFRGDWRRDDRRGHAEQDRKSTRLNSSHLVISYAVFCLKKKKTATKHTFHVVDTLSHS